MIRADVLVLELLLHLAEGYRNRYQQCSIRRCNKHCRDWVGLMIYDL